jgi:hypothetical protein
MFCTVMVGCPGIWCDKCLAKIRLSMSVGPAGGEVDDDVKRLALIEWRFFRRQTFD